MKINKRNNKIKKVLKGILIIAICIVTIAIVGYNNNHYTAKGQVKEVENYTITIIDKAGEEWTYTISELYNKDDKVKIYFNENKTTNNRTDDIITKVKKIK